MLGTWSRQSTLQSGLPPHGPGQLRAMVTTLERLAAAVVAVERRKVAYGRGQQRETYEGVKVADIVQVSRGEQL